MNTKNAERYETELGDRETVLTGSVIALPTVDFGESNWERTIFSDEKKWSLNGPDGLQQYWHCLRHEEKAVFSRQNGGESVMIWAGIWADGATKLTFVEGTQTADDYVNTLSEYLLPAAHRRFVFQQDNASIHTARYTKAFFRDQEMKVMDWPALSHDLNPIENVWGYLVQRVYFDAVFKQIRPEASDFPPLEPSVRRIPQKPCIWNEKAVHQGHSEQGEDNQILVSAVGFIFGSILTCIAEEGIVVVTFQHEKHIFFIFVFFSALFFNFIAASRLLK